MRYSSIERSDFSINVRFVGYLIAMVCLTTNCILQHNLCFFHSILAQNNFQNINWIAYVVLRTKLYLFSFKLILSLFLKILLL